jgi:hypothetical protein
MFISMYSILVWYTMLVWPGVGSRSRNFIPAQALAPGKSFGSLQLRLHNTVSIFQKSYTVTPPLSRPKMAFSPPVIHKCTYTAHAAISLAFWLAFQNFTFLSSLSFCMCLICLLYHVQALFVLLLDSFWYKKTVILITNSFFYINKYLYFVFLTFFCYFHVKRTVKSLCIENFINGAAQLVVILKLQKNSK